VHHFTASKLSAFTQYFPLTILQRILKPQAERQVEGRREVLLQRVVSVRLLLHLRQLLGRQGLFLLGERLDFL
jgi:hypothetical protein